VVRVITRIVGELLAELAAELLERSSEERLAAIEAVREHVRKFEGGLQQAGAACAPLPELAGQELGAGCWAEFQGLQSRTALNGCPCRVLTLCAAGGSGPRKCSVRLPTTGQSLVVACNNLRVRPAPLPDLQVRGAGGCDAGLLANLQAELSNDLRTTNPASVGSGAVGGLRLVLGALARSATFAEEFFARRPVVLHCGDAVAHLWTQVDQMQLCEPPEAGSPEGSLLKAGPHCRFTHEGIGGQKVHSFCALAEEGTVLTSAAVHRRLKSSTWVLSGVEAVAQPVAELCRAVQEALGLPFVSCNCYMSGLDLNVTAPMHTDRMDSFIVQTEGSKRWRVYGNSEELPPWPVQDANVPDRGKNGEVLMLHQAGPLLLDELLRPGDVLYLPRGLPHATSTIHTTAMHGKEQPTRVSTSLTVSILLETVGLTYDKLLRCAAGMGDGGGVPGVRSEAAEEVLRETPCHQELRRVLPLGFLARFLATPDGSARVGERTDSRSSGELPATGGGTCSGDAWAQSVAAEARRLAWKCGLKRLVERGDEGEAALHDIARHVWERAEAAAEHCRNAVLADGRTQQARPMCERQKAGGDELAGFAFYPEQGRIYTQPPVVRGPGGTATPMAAAAPGVLPPGAG